MEDGVVEFEHLSSDKFIVAVDNQKNLIGPAELLGCPSQIGHCSLLLSILDHVEFLSGEALLFDKFFHFIPCAISGGVIDEYYVEVGVFLHDDGLYVLDVEIVVHVVVAWHHDAKWQLFVLADLVFLFIVVFLLLRQL